jgi:hypothetical protein
MDGNLTPPVENVQTEMNMADYMGELAKNMQNLVSSMFGQNKKD